MSERYFENREFKEYETVCNEAGIRIKRFPDVDAFVADYSENN